MTSTQRLVAVLSLLDSGPITLGAVIRATGLTPQGARFLVLRLERDGVIKSTRSLAKRGTPRGQSRREWVRT